MPSIKTTRPHDFYPSLEGAGCFCCSQDRLLFLRRSPTQLHANCWCVPGGKLEPGETPLEGALREVREETGLHLLLSTHAAPSQEKSSSRGRLPQFLGSLYVASDINFSFHLFECHFDHRPAVSLNLREHTRYRWLTIEEAFALPLIEGGKEAIELFCLKQSKLL